MARLVTSSATLGRSSRREEAGTGSFPVSSFQIPVLTAGDWQLATGNSPYGTLSWIGHVLGSATSMVHGWISVSSV